MQKYLVLSLSLVIATTSFYIFSNEPNKDYLNNLLPNDSLIKQRCKSAATPEECEACKDIESALQINEENCLSLKEPSDFLSIVLKKRLDENIKNAIRIILAKEDDATKWAEYHKVKEALCSCLYHMELARYQKEKAQREEEAKKSKF